MKLSVRNMQREKRSTEAIAQATKKVCTSPSGVGKPV